MYVKGELAPGALADPADRARAEADAAAEEIDQQAEMEIGDNGHD